MNLPISEILDEAWTLSKKYGFVLAVYLFLLSLVSGGLNVAFMPSGYWEAVMSGDAEAINSYSRMNFGTILQYLVSFVGNVGMVVTMLRLARGSKENISLSSFNLPLGTYLKYLGWAILYGLIVAVGIVFFIIPGVYLGARLGFACVYILDHPEASIEEAVKFSWQQTEGRVLSLVGLALISFIITVLGLLACCIGFFFTAVIAQFAFILTYLFLSNPDSLFSKSAPNASSYDKTAY